MSKTDHETIKRRQLPKLYACMTKNSLENMRNRAVFSLELLDAKGVRRMKLPLHECIILELKESGYVQASSYLHDLIYDNEQLLKEDDLGIVVDLRKRSDYLDVIALALQKAEKCHDKGDSKTEALHLLGLARNFVDREKGILWLAEKIFLASIAVASQYLLDGGRMKSVCKYYYAKFLLDKFPALDEEPFTILTDVRDCAIGKKWLLKEDSNDAENKNYQINETEKKNETVFRATATLLHGVLLSHSRKYRATDVPKAERLARLAERRANDAEDTEKLAEAIIEMGICQLLMNNLNNAQKTFDRALKIYEKSNNIEGICETKMHLAAVMQRLGEHEIAAKLLTEMGVLAMEHGLRRQLGRALHLLGELHLRRERPELGTQHLSEAFLCFMGVSTLQFSDATSEKKEDEAMKSTTFTTDDATVFEEEAEQSRLMTAISAGQEVMASYFDLLREADTCTVARMKTIEWKLDKHGWWIHKRDYDFLPCLCPLHNRSPIDVLRRQLQEAASAIDIERTDSEVNDNIPKHHSNYVLGFK